MRSWMYLHVTIYIYMYTYYSLLLMIRFLFESLLLERNYIIVIKEICFSISM